MNKLTVKELYSALRSNIENKDSPQIYFEKMVPNKPIKWDEMFLLPGKVTYNTYLQQPTLFFGGFFCKHEHETILHIFYS